MEGIDLLRESLSWCWPPQGLIWNQSIPGGWWRMVRWSIAIILGKMDHRWFLYVAAKKKLKNLPHCHTMSHIYKCGPPWERFRQNIVLKKPVDPKSKWDDMAPLGFPDRKGELCRCRSQNENPLERPPARWCKCVQCVASEWLEDGLPYYIIIYNIII